MKIKKGLRFSRRQHSITAIRSRSNVDVFLSLFKCALIPDNFLLPLVHIAGRHESTEKKISIVFPQEREFYSL